MIASRTAIAISCVLATASGAYAEGVTITLWQASLGGPLFENRIAAYEAASGNTVEIVSASGSAMEETVLTRWATGDRPDVLEFHPSLSALDRLNAAENMIDIGNEDFIARNASTELAGRASNGTIYAIQTMFPDIWGEFYSVPVLAAAGLEPATTFEELKDQCPILAAAGIVPVFQGGASGWPMWGTVLTYAGTVMADDWINRANTNQARLTDDDSPMLAAYKFWGEMADAGCFNTDIAIATYESATQAIVDGEAAYTFLPSALLNTFLEASGGDHDDLAGLVGFSSIGAKEQKLAVSAGPTGSFILPKTGNPEQEAAALDFVRFVTSQEQYSAFVEENAFASVFTDVPDSPNLSPLTQQFKAMYSKGPRVPLYDLNLVAGMANGSDVTRSFVAGEITAEEAVDELQGGIDIIAEARGLEGWN